VSGRVITFGCRLNACESEVIRGHLAGADDVIVINTCAVTAEAERQARQAIRRARREAPGARIIVTGCAAQIHSGAFAAMAEVDRVVGNAEKLAPETFAEGGPRVAVGDLAALGGAAVPVPAGFADRTRAFLQVQDGCDHRCTFCIIPLGRGPARSVPEAAVIAQARRLVAAGHRELVLTGVDLTAYRCDDGGLGRLVRRLLAAVPELPRLRLSSVDVAEVDDDLLAAFADEPRLMPHLHLSLQAGDDLMLKRMKRRHSRAQAIALCDRLRALRPGIAFGADLIAGFPTEDEAAFARTLDLVEAAGLAYLHVFPFSPREGTPAARMPPVPRPLRRARAARLREAGREALARHLAARVGSRARVLVERPGLARDEDFSVVRVAATLAPGTLAAVVIEGVGDGVLEAAAPAEALA